MKSLISVIIPVYNGEAFVEKCIKSVLAQSISDLQIIMVDDGSSDGTLSILHEYALKDSRIEVIHQENGGVSKARNAGLAIVRGEWVLFIDSDDSVTPDYCESMLNAAQLLSIDILIARPGTERQEQPYILKEHEKLMQACLSYDEISFSFNIDAPWGKLFRSSLIKENQICFPETLTRSEDAYFCLCAYEYAKTIGVLNQFGYIHNEREGSLCRSYTSNAPEILEKILIENQKWVVEHHPNEADYSCALWYRVLPGIIECEKAFFLHSHNQSTLFQIAIAYQRFLNQKMVQKAIRCLKISDMFNRQYRIRLLFYKLHLGWLFIMVKGK